MSGIYTAAAAPNIALVKYWGRRDDSDLNLPYNSSVSVTLHQDTVKTVTSVALDPRIKRDAIYVDGKLQDSTRSDEKVRLILGVVRDMKSMGNSEDGVLVVSRNNFPAGSGLASSASGGAALVFALNEALSLHLDDTSLSVLARRISGSACRSIFGGFVRWKMGTSPGGEDSYAEQIAPPSHWKLIDVIGIVSASRKKVSSSAGHLITPRTSTLYRSRLELAERNAESAIRAIEEKDFERLAEITMADSNNMHATMLDSWPPIKYMNEKSWRVVDAVHEMNSRYGKSVAAYTFDAGPNAHVITTPKYEREVEDVVGDALGEGARVLASRIGNSPKLIGRKDSLIDDSLKPLQI